ILLLGPTGAGKSTWLRLFLTAILAAMPCLAMGFDRKRGELIDSATLARPGLPVLVLHWRELKIAMLQPPPGLDPTVFANGIVHLLAREASLHASRRLLLETVAGLYRRPRPRGTYPTFAEWLSVVEMIRVSATSRLGNYREAALYMMRQVLIELGD